MDLFSNSSMRKSKVMMMVRKVEVIIQWMEWGTEIDVGVKLDFIVLFLLLFLFLLLLLFSHQDDYVLYMDCWIIVMFVWWFAILVILYIYLISFHLAILFVCAKRQNFGTNRGKFSNLDYFSMRPQRYIPQSSSWNSGVDDVSQYIFFHRRLNDHPSQKIP